MFVYADKPNSAALTSIALVALVFIAVRTTLSYLGVPKPASIAVVVCLVVATLSMRQHAIRWSDFGFAAPESWPLVLMIALGAFVAVALAVGFVVEPLANLTGLEAQAFEKLGPLQENRPYLVFMIVFIGWSAAGFGEELLFRGFFLNRLETVFAPVAHAAALAVVAQALLFGLGHIYLGARGVAVATAVGLIFGIFFVLTGRNLWPLIIAHGVIDTVSLYALYAGVTSN